MPRRRLALLFLSLVLFTSQAVAAPAPYIRLPPNLSRPGSSGQNTRAARIARSQERLQRRQDAGTETSSAWAPTTTKYQTYNITTAFGTEVWQCLTVLSPTTSSSGEMEYEEDQSCVFTLIADAGVDVNTLPPPIVPSGVLTPQGGAMQSMESVLSFTPSSSMAMPTTSAAAVATAAPDSGAASSAQMVTSVNPAGDSTFLIPAAATSVLGITGGNVLPTSVSGSTLMVAPTSSAVGAANSAPSPGGNGQPQAGDDGASIIGTSSIPVASLSAPQSSATAPSLSIPTNSSASSSASALADSAPTSSVSAPEASQLASILFGTPASSSVGATLASAVAPSGSGVANSGALQSANDTTTTAALTIPGQSIQVLPIGLGVFAGIMVIALIVVGIVTFERTQYRKAFRARKMAEQGGAMGYGGMAERA